MAPSTNAAVTLPLIPLPKGSILLPGTVLRVPITAARTDIRAVLARVYTRDTKTRLENAIVCVPLASPLLSRTGQRLIRSKDEISKSYDTVDVNPADARKDDLFAWATIAKVAGVEGQVAGQLALMVEGVARVKVEKITQEKPYFEATVVHHDSVVPANDSAILEMFTQLKALSTELVALLQLSSMFPRETSRPVSPLIYRRLRTFIEKKTLDEAGVLSDFMTNIVEGTTEEKLQILAAVDIKDRLERSIELLSRQLTRIKSGFKITTIMSTTLPSDVDFPGSNSSEHKRSSRGDLPPPGFMNMMGMGGGMPGNRDQQEVNEIDEIKKRLDDANLTPEAAKVAERELQRLQKMSPAQAEYQVCRNYLETLAEIPWSRTTEDQLGVDTLSRARKQLDGDHYGLERVKKRLLEYLAVLKLKQSINKEVDAQVVEAEQQVAALDKDKSLADTIETSDVFDEKAKATSAKLEVLKSKKMIDKSPILLLVGPPGVGKTSLAKSVATALGRKFHRISLGGVRDEAEIRGHRRTYVAAMPGLIVNGLKKVGVCNPVFLLDEIDKVGGSSFHGDPSAAMLEVLDPEQNHSFVDHYVNIPIDLSKVLFIATANSLDTIPPPLLDRMETISLAGYTTLEKRHIATQHLIPKQIRSNGLSETQVNFPEDVISKIIESYTRESGVRNLEREIGSVCRYKAVEYSDAQDSGHPEQYNPTLSLDDIEAILGIEKYEEEIAEKTSRPGIVTGLVAYSSGGNGSILFIEVADMPGGKGRVQLTGSLGDVLRESVEVALTWVKAHAFELGLTPDPSVDIMGERSIHVHCPSGAIPKDGPSAGVAHTIALISLFSGKAVPPTLAMTGEISLRGRITAVGGIKEKLIGALRAGVKTVLLPAQNRKDTKDLPVEVKEGLEIIFVSHIWEAMRHVWPDAHWPGEHHHPGIESRL